jgi:superfamily I DNA/RNA helicase
MPKIRARLQAKFKHVLVDEFQDTDATQLEILRLITSGAISKSTPAVGLMHDDAVGVSGNPNNVETQTATASASATFGEPNPAELKYLSSSYSGVGSNTESGENASFHLPLIPTTTRLHPPSILATDEQALSEHSRKVLMDKSCSLFLVGDINQSIYGWRGAVGGHGSNHMLKILTRSSRSADAAVSSGVGSGVSDDNSSFISGESSSRDRHNSDSLSSGNHRGVTSFSLSVNYRCSPPIIAVANAFLQSGNRASTSSAGSNSSGDVGNINGSNGSAGDNGTVIARAPDYKTASKFLPVQVNR